MNKSIIKCGTYTLEVFINSTPVNVDLASDYIRNTIVDKSDKAFDNCIDRFIRGENALESEQGTISVMLDCYYPSDYNGPVSRARDIFFSMCNSSRQDDLYYNGYLNLLGALADCDTTKERFMHVSIFIFGSEWYMYNGDRPINVGNGNIIQTDSSTQGQYSHITNGKDDTVFFLLKSSENVYQSSDFVVEVENQDARKVALSEFRELMNDARMYLNIPKDRFIIGVLTTYTNDLVEYAKKYNSDNDIYELALDLVIYMMNYRSKFDKRHLDMLIRELMKKPVEDQPTGLLYILEIDIISPTTAVFTLNGDMIAMASIPEDWYPKLMEANGIDISGVDE